ncbi:fungal pheromone STE3G-protein-coupled receptor [Tricholoma matsutake]|nr:fungal pheromone STE3G-protein-coupled receptor [Tricholoma matsutake 945]
MDPTYPLFPIFAFLGFILSLISLPWHFQAWNSETCFYMMWTSLACLIKFVNSIVWHGNALNPHRSGETFAIRIIMGGLPASSLCINRRLYHIVNVRAVSTTREEKPRKILMDPKVMDSAICALFPVIYIVLQYVVQGHRFDVLEDIWMLSILTLRSFVRRRAEFNQIMSSNRSLTMGRWHLRQQKSFSQHPKTWTNSTATPVGPWRSWADTHFAFSRVEQISAVVRHENYLVALAFEFSRWVVVFCALVFFAFLGFAEEARKNYQKSLRFLTKSCRYPLWLSFTSRFSNHSACFPIMTMDELLLV